MTPVPATLALNPSLTLPAGGEREKLAAAAKQFEAVFLRQMLAAARKADYGDSLFDSEGLDTFRELQDDHFAGLAAETGALGLAAIIEAQLARNLPAET